MMSKSAQSLPRLSRLVAAMAILALLAATAPALAANCSRYMGEDPPYDYSSLPKNSWITKTWYIQNCGDTTWTTSWGVKKISGNTCGSFNFTKSTAPGYTATVYATCYLGTAAQYEAHFKVKTPAGVTFGEEFWFIFNTY